MTCRPSIRLMQLELLDLLASWRSRGALELTIAQRLEQAVRDAEARKLTLKGHRAAVVEARRMERDRVEGPIL